MNSKKFIEESLKEGFEASEIVISTSKDLSFSLFHSEMDSYSVSSTSKIYARGIYKGNLAFATTEKDDKDTIKILLEQLKSNSSLIEKKEKPIIFKGSEKYSHTKNVYNVSLENIKTEDKIDLLYKLESKIKSLDKRISEVQVSYSESSGETKFTNSYGLNLKNKGNYFYIYAEVVVKDNDEVKASGDIFLNNDLSLFNLDEFAKKVVESATSLLHGTTIKNKKYKAVLNQETVAGLLNALLSNLNAENVQKHSSLFENKIGEQVLSKKITIDELPLTKNCFFSYFDDEGVACQNKRIFSKGKLLTYFYNLETANKDNVASTGNARRQGSKMGISFSNIVLKPGKLTEEELFKKIKDGVYITEISGLHAGLNAESGDFSLQAQGFHIENGTKKGPLTLITVAGNLFTLFNDIIAVGNNSKLTLSSTNVPSIAIKNLAVNAD